MPEGYDIHTLQRYFLIVSLMVSVSIKKIYSGVEIIFGRLLSLHEGEKRKGRYF